MGQPHMNKPRVRVKAGSAPASSAPARERATARWLRDGASGVLSMRQASLVESRDETRRAWHRIAALAVDFIQNSGRLKGAVDQIIADTVGNELKLRAKPDLSALGYSAEETNVFARMAEQRWRRYAWNPAEVDFRGKFSLPQLLDIGLRHHVAFGEALGLIEFMGRAERRRYGIGTGTKLLLVTPTRLVSDTNEVEGLFQGVRHDENGRPLAYRLQHREAGLNVKRDHRVRDAQGRQLIVHCFDPWDGSDVRGISPIAAAMRTHAHSEQLQDVTLATAILQTVFAATLTSPEPSNEAFNAIESLDDDDGGLKADFLGYFENALDQARKSRIALDGTGQVSHLAPGEKLELHTASTPGGVYLPFSADLRREMARSLGITADSIRTTLETAFGTYIASQIQTTGNNYDVIVELDQSLPWDETMLGSLRVPTSSGALVPLSSFATVTRTNGPVTVNQSGQLASVTLSFNLPAGVSLGTATARVDALRNQIGMPASVTTHPAGAAQIFAQSTGNMGLLILAAVATIYIVLGVLYESFVHPLTILSGLPSAAFGALITLQLFGFDLSIIALIGLLMLIGIVKKNAIMMVDVALTLKRDENREPMEAIHLAAVRRFRPIMMTTFCALLAAVPVALGHGQGSELRQPLGVAVVGGLVLSQILTLFITPVIFVEIDRISNMRWFRRGRAEPAPQAH